MDSVIENQRQTHEEIERLQRALSTVLSRAYPTQQAHIANQHKASQILERIGNRQHELNASYNNATSRQAELDALSAPTAGGDDLSEFYSRLGSIREHHMKYPDTVPGAFETELQALVEDTNADDYEDEDREPNACIVFNSVLNISFVALSVMFSGEEAFGRYVDLYAQHTAYSNLKHLRKRPTYLQYLDTLISVTQLPLHVELTMETKQSKEYESSVSNFIASSTSHIADQNMSAHSYLESLHGYLLSFTKRTRPLSDVDKEILAAEVEFNSNWEAGAVTDWQKAGSAGGQAESGIWCDACKQNLLPRLTVLTCDTSRPKDVLEADRVRRTPWVEEAC